LNNDIPIFMYHSIAPRTGRVPLDFLSFTEDEFRSHLLYLKKNNYLTLTLSDLWKLDKDIIDQDKQRFAVITFDDGYLDNGLTALKILQEFNMTATIFINPDFVDNSNENRLHVTNDSSWGYLNIHEIKSLAGKNIFDFQSHTMSHNHVFVSDKIIDFYSPDKFNKYYWLSWLLFPDLKSKWMEQMDKLSKMIPAGYPIFENHRALSGKQFLPDSDFISFSINKYKSCSVSIEYLNNSTNKKGRFEENTEYDARIQYEIGESKTFIEDITNKTVDFICFPGGTYTTECLEWAKRFGFKAYMASSKVQVKNNLEALKRHRENNLVCLKRISISKNYPSFFKNKMTDYLLCKLKVEQFLKKKIYFLQFLRKFRDIFQRIF